MPVVYVNDKTYANLKTLMDEDGYLTKGRLVTALVERRMKDERKWDHIKGAVLRPYPEDRLFTALKMALDNNSILPIQAIKIWRQVTLCDLHEAARIVQEEMRGLREIVLFEQAEPHQRWSQWVNQADAAKFAAEGVVPDKRDGGYLPLADYLAKYREEYTK